MKRWLLVVALVGCKEKATPDNLDIEDVKDDAAVEWARKELANIETQLQSDDPGRASSGCAVIKPDMAKIKQRDPKLAAKLAQRCGKDLALRSLTVMVEKAEKARAANPEDRMLLECRSFDIYMEPITAAGAESDPSVAKLRDRHTAACPPRN